MFRRSIFLGLMVLLGSVLIYLILSARKQEKRIASPPAEIIRQSKPSATRVLSPPDLQVAVSTMEVVRTLAGSSPAVGVLAHHTVTLRNRGSRHYRGFMLKFSYSTSSGSSVEVRSCQVAQDLPPGETVGLPQLSMEGLPTGVKTCSVSISWADLVD